MGVLLVATAVTAFARLAEEHAFLARYVFAPLVDIGQGLAAADELDRMLTNPPPDLRTSVRGPILRLRAFIDEYQRDWETGSSALPEAARLRAVLEAKGLTNLLGQEHEVVGECNAAVHRLEQSAGLGGLEPADPPLRSVDVEAVTDTLVRLNLLNQRYVQVGYRKFERTHQWVAGAFFALSLAAIGGAVLLGFAIRRAIGPRVALMVAAVERFRNGFPLEPMDDSAGDDLAMLARTLNVSLRSIAERDKERERFLAVAAHELKTPLTTLKGFAQIALDRTRPPALRDRALAVIDRQTTRLAHLAQDLLWSARRMPGGFPTDRRPSIPRHLQDASSATSRWCAQAESSF